MKTTQFIENQSPILHYFDQIYIINLETRDDRRKEVEVELANIGISLSHPNVKLFRVKKPTDFEGWPSAGTKGCFLSHLNILKDAQKMSQPSNLTLPHHQPSGLSGICLRPTTKQTLPTTSSVHS